MCITCIIGSFPFVCSLKELGASSVTPILTERSHTIAENRVERLERVVVAAVKQCNQFLASFTGF